MASQFLSLFRKSFKVWRRSILGSLCEFCMMLFSAVILVVIFSLIKTTTKKTTSYLRLGEVYTLSPPPSLQSLGFPSDYLALNDFAKAQSKAMLIKDCNYDNPENPRSGIVALAPPNNPVLLELEKFFKGVNFRVQWFDSKQQIENFVRSKRYGGMAADGKTNQICLGVSFDSFDLTTQRFDYNLHFNATGTPVKREIQEPKEKPLVTPYQKEDTNNYFKNIGSGLAFLQHMVDTLIVRQAAADPSLQITAKMIKVPVTSYVYSTLFEITGGSISLYVIFGLLGAYLRFVYFILSEKENRIAQNLRNMGMRSLPYYFSWIGFYSLVVLVLSLVWTLIVGLTFFKQSNKLLVFLTFFLTGLFFLSMGFFLSSFFTRAKPGVLMALVLFFLLYGGNIGLQAVSEPRERDFNLFSISPFAALEKACSSMIMVESSQYGFGFEHFSDLINNYRYSTFIYFTIAETILLFVLGMYLDQVFPTETGVKKHPLFCLKCKKKYRDEHVNIVRPEEKASDLIEQMDRVTQLQIGENKAVVIKGLRKVYPNGKVAVDGLNVEMYSDQIFALLGHNGAGKTTTISMMSGLIDKTSGSISILGLDSSANHEQIQHVMGICPQRNPIYSELTVQEHLELYSDIKKQPVRGERYDQSEEIKKVLQDIDLYDKRDYPAGKLSGGQKRKLCVALAFIGDSKVVILDEPTSGMDTYARRHLWEMLKNYKKGRVLVLTTHYMDEADYLGDRIGIMGDGMLLTCGTSLFLKSRFGAGYNLTVVKTNPEIANGPIVDQLTTKIPGAKLAASISMELKFQLPIEQSRQFAAAFEAFDANKQSLGIQSYGITMTTLEEVFLKVALDKTEREELEKQHHEGEKEEVMKVDAQPLDGFDKELEEIRIKDKNKVFRMHFEALCRKRFLYFKRDVKGLVCEIIIPILILSVGLLITLVRFITESQDFEVFPSSLGRDRMVSLFNSPTADFLKSRNQIGGMAFEQGNWNAVEELDDYLLYKNDPDRLFSFYVNKFDKTTKQFDYSIYLNTTASLGLNVAVNIMNEEVLRAVTANPGARLKSRIRVMPLTEQWKTFENSADGLISVFLISLACSFIPSSLIMFIVYERENNAKHLQRVSGVSLTAYWSSNLLIDYAKYLVCGVYMCLAMQIYGIETFTRSDVYGMVWLLMALYGPAMILFTYVTSFWFKSPSAAQVFTFVFNYFTSLILMMLAFILRLIPSTRNYSRDVVEYFLRVFPSFNFSFGLMALPNDTVWQAIYSLDTLPGPWGWYGGAKECIALGLVILYSIACIWWFENSSAPSLKPAPALPEANTQPSARNNLITEDDEVKKEADDVKSSSDFAVKVQDLTKVFNIFEGGRCCTKKKLLKTKHAVNNISFGVKKGDCFGLLGTNGAGKSTTFKILTGELSQSFGVARINGFDISSDLQRIVHNIGYCPQFDALLANLTAKEHLELYCSIKAIPLSLRHRMIEHLLQRLNLKRYENVQAGTYSGGNMRKLSVAIALLGNPAVVFLDEPSSGMDPEARRFMWSVVAGITALKKTSSVILTTHSMDEAEALSSKLAIMVEGQIKCIGSVQQLKDKYGKGYEIEIKINAPLPEDILALAEKLIMSSNLEEELSRTAVETAFKDSGSDQLVESLSKEEGACSLLLTQVSSC